MLLRIKKKHTEEIVDTNKITDIHFYEYKDLKGIHRMVRLTLGNISVHITRRTFTDKVKQYLNNVFVKVRTTDNEEVWINKKFIKFIYKQSAEKREDITYSIYIEGSEEPYVVREFPNWTETIGTAVVIEIKER